MKVILFQDFGPNVNFLKEVCVSGETEATFLANAENAYLSDSGFPPKVRWVSPSVFSSISKKSECIQYALDCRRYGTEAVLSPDSIREKLE